MNTLATKSRSSRRFGRFVLTAVTVILLLPVPATAFVFLGTWNLVQRAFGVGPAIFQSGDPAGGGTDLVLNSGASQPNPANPQPATISASLTRDLRITNDGGETLTLLRNVSRALQDTSYKSFITITPISGTPGRQVTLFSGNVTTGARFGKTVEESTTHQATLPKGDYRLTITVKYKKGRLGGFGTSSIRSASPFRINTEARTLTEAGESYLLR